jgi:hypothetical protein
VCKTADIYKCKSSDIYMCKSAEIYTCKSAEIYTPKTADIYTCKNEETAIEKELEKNIGSVQLDLPTRPKKFQPFVN